MVGYCFVFSSIYFFLLELCTLYVSDRYKHLIHYTMDIDRSGLVENDTRRLSEKLELLLQEINILKEKKQKVLEIGMCVFFILN